MNARHGRRAAVATLPVFLLLLALTPCVTQPLQAAEEARVSGKVVDLEGEPVGEITLEFHPANPETPRVEVEVNKKGRFANPATPSGTYVPRILDRSWEVRKMHFVVRGPDGVKADEFEDEIEPGGVPRAFTAGPLMRATLNLVVARVEQRRLDAADQLQAVKDDAPQLAELNRMFEAADWSGLIARSAEVLASNPELGGAHYLRAVALMQSDRNAEAVQSMRRAAELVPDQPAIKGTLATLLLQYANRLREGGSTDEATAAYSEAADLLEQQLEQTPDSVVYLTNRVVALQGSGRMDDVIPALERLIAAEPGNTDSYIRLAEMLTNSGRPEEAVEWLKKIPGGGNSAAIAIYNAAVEMWNTGNLEATVLALDTAIEMAPDMPDLYRLKGRSLISIDQAQALEVLKHYLSMVPEDEPGADADRALVEALSASKN